MSMMVISPLAGSDRWVNVMELKDLTQNVMRLIYPKGVGMLLLRRGDQVMALSNRCPHMGCALASGTLEGDLLRCPCHDWIFDVTTGELVVSREIRLLKYLTKVEGGMVFVKLED